MPRRKSRQARETQKPPRAGPVTVARLPLVKCGEKGCKWSKAVLPGQNASKLLTEHYKEKHVI